MGFLLTLMFLAFLATFSTMLEGTVSASINDDYCYDQDLEDTFCYGTQKTCENERKNDLMAESKCYKAIE